MSDVRTRVNRRLAEFFEEKRGVAEGVSPTASELVSAVGTLTMRGGKRFRPAMAVAGFRSVSRDRDIVDITDLLAALELLQSYLLIHDDWMDQDDRRRNGPSVHAAFEENHADRHLAASLAILAGDLAAGFAWELLNRVSVVPERSGEAIAEFASMHQEVVFGQQLDLLACDDVALMHHLKTGSYTVRGPLRLGAVFGDAGPSQLAALDRFGAPLGIAFQLRDDLLGVFGDGNKTGKPVGGDLRAGKNTALVAEARALLEETERRSLERVLGDPSAPDDAVAEAIRLLDGCGVRRRIEERLDERLGQARAALQTGSLLPAGVAMLDDLLGLLGNRDR
jgi:geranylgeranyl diphosphate synthase type I